MGQITAAVVKELREKTGAGMMDCKKALAETDADMDAAVDWLRSKGLSKAAKKSGRAAAEGLVIVQPSDCGKNAVVVEVNSETDFVSRNEEFQTFVKNVAGLALDKGTATVEELAALDYGSGKSVADTLTDLIAKIGENMTLRRVGTASVDNGLVATYVHNAVAPNMGKIGVSVSLESSADKAALEALGKQLAMHIAAAKPEFLTVEDVDAETLDRERAVLIEQAKESGKPDAIIEKMVEGRIRKYYEEIVLLEQVFVMDGETKVSKVIENAAKEAGAEIKLAAYTRFVLGEGVEVEETDFAAEVAAAVGA